MRFGFKIPLLHSVLKSNGKNTASPTKTFVCAADYSCNMEGVKAKSVWDRKKEIQGNSQQVKAAAFLTKSKKAPCYE